ncbi:MAG: OmpA family protein [Massilibacteroides sp.]|nr:OmpA family protein [Massilibacteroides sp.]
MKTKSLVLALLSVFAITISAQEYQPQVGFSTKDGSKTNFKKNKAGDNWFITLGVGGNVLFGDDNSEADFGDRINIAPQISFGKWYNPYWGARLQINGGPMKSFVDPNGTNELKAYWLNPHVDFLWDITNYWAPYKESKVFRFIPFAGIGYAIRSGKSADLPKNYSRSETPSINLGAIMSFRLSKRVDLNIEGQYVLLQEHFNRVEKAHTTDRVGQVTAGLNFKLGKTDFEVLQPMDYALLNDLNSQINALRAENDELSRRPVSCPECEEVAPTIINNYSENVVYFRLNSAKIDKNQQINIYNTAEFMKEKNAPIKVIGYADKKTGTAQYNMGLSEKRARAVAKELIEKYNISSNQITIEWKGSDEQPYSENNWNRVVIMRANN